MCTKYLHLKKWSIDYAFLSNKFLFQEAMLKTELRNMERSQKREGIDMTYLKNVILKLLETG
jgi:hypothetical protein